MHSKKSSKRTAKQQPAAKQPQPPSAQQHAAAHSKAAAHSTAQPGIIASIMQQLIAAKQSKHPVTAAAILAQLCKQFPQRTASGMLITVRAQLSRLPGERNFAINKVRDGKFVTYAAQ